MKIQLNGEKLKSKGTNSFALTCEGNMHVILRHLNK